MPSVSVKRRMNREWKRFYLNNMQQTETRIQMIKMVNEFKLTVVHFARPNPMQICACAWIYRWTKKLWKIRTGPPGLRAAGPSRAVGWGLGPLSRGPAFSKTPFWCTVLVHQYGLLKSTKTSGAHFFYKSSLFSLENYNKNPQLRNLHF